MARKNKTTENEVKIDPNAWMVTFGDLLMLLLTFFVMLLTMKSMDNNVVKQMFDHFITTKGPFEDNYTHGGGGILDGDGYCRKSIMIIDSEMLKKILDLMKGIDKLPVNAGKLEDLRNIIEISEDHRGVIISLESDYFFEPGKAGIKNSKLAILDATGELLRHAANDILIMGHTDNLPIRKGTFESNWELSFYRSLSVLFYLSDSMGLKAESMASGGYGDLLPRYPNDNPEHRARNRRVEFILRKAE